MLSLFEQCCCYINLWEMYQIVANLCISLLKRLMMVDVNFVVSIQVLMLGYRRVIKQWPAFTQYSQQDATFLSLFISVRHCTDGFSVHHQELKTAHTASGTVFVRPLLLPAASLAYLAAGSSNGLTNT